MLDKVPLKQVLFIDIETVPEYPDFDSLPEDKKELWEKIANTRRNRKELPADEFYEQAGIYSEFGKIVCISAGLFTNDDGDQLEFRVKSFYDKDEKKVIQGFNNLLDNYYYDLNRHYICGHNIKEFDIPYVCRRILVHGLDFPRLLDISGAKPWETDHLIDTMVLWKFGDFKNFTSLEVLASLFNIPTPKDDIEGSDVKRVFWEEDDLERITTYCQKDVVTVAQLFLRFKREPLIEEENITFV